MEKTENSKTDKPHRFRSSLADKRNLKIQTKNIALGNLGISYTWKIIKLACNNNKFQIFTSFWNDTFYLPDRFYSIATLIYSRNFN